MPRKTSGSVVFDKQRNKYRAFLTLPSGKRISERFETERQANDWLSCQQTDIGRGTFIEPNAWTLGEWLVEYLVTYAAQRIRPRTLEHYSALCNHTAPIANIRLQQLAPHHIQRVYNDMTQSNATKLKLHNVLHGAIKQAVVNKLVASNVMENIQAPKVIQKEIEIFTQDELQKIFERLQDHRYYPAVLLSATSGIRMSELLGLRWQDVNFTDKNIYIRQTLSHTRSGIVFSPPKTAHSKRKIGLPHQTMQALKKHHIKALERQLATGEVLDLVFTAINGSPIQPRNFDRFWRNLINDEMVMEFRGYHCLRHTHASMLLASGVPITEVSRRLGHSKVSVTLDIYAHCIPGNEQALINKIDKLYFLDG